eukprot:8435120-Pyramimonas_sp.AAC.1
MLAQARWTRARCSGCRLQNCSHSATNCRGSASPGSSSPISSARVVVRHLPNPLPAMARLACLRRRSI